MILSTFNQKKHQIRMLSIPRDTISYIPKVGYYDKITHAHAMVAQLLQWIQSKQQ